MKFKITQALENAAELKVGGKKQDGGVWLMNEYEIEAIDLAEATEKTLEHFNITIETI